MQVTKKKIIIAASALVLGIGALAACDSATTSQQDQAVQRSQARQNYVPKNDVEGRNYNARQKLADDPTSIIWCSIYPTNPNVKAYTVPIVGKLTSGNKRPFPTSQVDGNNVSYTPELPGPDGFYGTSGEYRYGFDPSGVYYDLYNVETVCTSAPTLIQRQTTTIAVTAQPSSLAGADARAEAALKVCRAKNPDPSVPCPAAAQILGVG